MRYGFHSLWEFYKSPKGKKLYRYVMGSVITTIVSFAVLTLIYGVFKWWGAVTSTVIANVIATIPAYYLNRSWTWGKYGRSDVLREITPFWVLSIIGILASIGTAALAAHIGRAEHFDHLVDVVVVNAANLTAYGVLFIGKYLVFNHLFRLNGAPRPLDDESAPSEDVEQSLPRLSLEIPEFVAGTSNLLTEPLYSISMDPVAPTEVAS